VRCDAKKSKPRVRTFAKKFGSLSNTSTVNWVLLQPKTQAAHLSDEAK